MQSRHAYEEALEVAITNGNVWDVTLLIKLIKKSLGTAKLSNTNSEGRTFLSIALEKADRKIFLLLFDNVENNNAFLFKKDNKNRSVLHDAALNHDHSMTEDLLEMAYQKKRLEFYLEGDDNGNSPLHQAAISRNNLATEVILKKVKTFLDSTDGNTLFFIPQKSFEACLVKPTQLILVYGNDSCQLWGYKNDHWHLTEIPSEELEKALKEMNLPEDFNFSKSSIPIQPNTPLYPLIEKGHVYPTFLSWINRVNIEGNTPLHCALLSGSSITAAHLINYGADLVLPNNLLETPIILFVKLPIENQAEIFNALNSNRQERMLEAYRLLIEDKIEITTKIKTLEENYLTLAAMISLQKKIYCQLEMKTGPIIDEKINLIDKNVLPNIPNFTRRAAEMDLLEDDSFLNKKLLTQHPKENQTLEKNLTSDRVTLIHLISDMEQLLDSLQKRPSSSTTLKICLVLMLVCACALYLGILSYFLMDGTPRVNHHMSYGEKGSLLTTVIAACILFGLFSIVSGLWSKRINISQKEWGNIVGRLEEDILEKLHALEQKEELEHINYLPTEPQNIRELETELAKLSHSKTLCFGEQPVTDLPIDKLIETLTHLRDTLKIIQQDLNISRKPLSLFFLPERPPVIIDMESTSSEESDNDENVSLLNRKSLN